MSFQNLSGGQDLVIVRVTGVNESRLCLSQYRKDVEKFAERGLIKATEHLHKKTLPHVPYLTGRLRNESRVIVTGKGFNTKASVAFPTEYAIYVHEDMDAYHAPPTYAKFLTRTAYEERPAMNRIIWEEMRKAKLRRFL